MLYFLDDTPQGTQVISLDKQYKSKPAYGDAKMTPPVTAWARKLLKDAHLNTSEDHTSDFLGRFGKAKNEDFRNYLKDRYGPILNAPVPDLDPLYDSVDNGKIIEKGSCLLLRGDVWHRGPGKKDQKDSRSILFCMIIPEDEERVSDYDYQAHPGWFAKMIYGNSAEGKAIFEKWQTAGFDLG
jgi:hypothetical protein